MNYFLILLIISFFLASPAHAGMAEAKDLARNYNCQVTNIKLVGQDTGMDDASIYQATCALPAEASEDQKKANGALTITCHAALCSLSKRGSY